MSRIYDCHMHTSFSGDSDSSPESMINRAKEIGLSGVTITDHMDYGFPENPNPFTIDFDVYMNELAKLQQQYNVDGEFEILRGVELGLTLDAVTFNKKIMNDYNFDYCIGSIHVVDGCDPYYDSFWEGKHRETVCRHYYERTLENIQACPYVDALGHLDYVFRYGTRPVNEDTYGPYAEIVDAILQELIKKDIALEVNTGSYKKGMGVPNPSDLILSRYYELGGELITLGADAHTPEFVADHFDDAIALLKSIGFTEYFLYRNGVPRAMKL